MSNLGTLKPLPLPERKRKPVIPRFFDGKAVNGPLPYAESVRLWGMWKGRALRDFSIFHQPVLAGQTFELPGDLLWQLAMDGDAEFADDRVKKENEILAQAEELLRPRRNKDLPEFSNFATGQKVVA